MCFMVILRFRRDIDMPLQFNWFVLLPYVSWCHLFSDLTLIHIFFWLSWHLSCLTQTFFWRLYMHASFCSHNNHSPLTSHIISPAPPQLTYYCRNHSISCPKDNMPCITSLACCRFISPVLLLPLRRYLLHLINPNYVFLSDHHISSHHYGFVSSLSSVCTLSYMWIPLSSRMLICYDWGDVYFTP